jgi:solute carrier family 44 (choline transporter-like protein), member 2/4/5
VHFSKLADLWLQGMVTSGRGCTDMVCLILFAVFWGGMGWVGFKALSEGDPHRILYGIDSYGNYCGMINERDNGTAVLDLRKKTKLYYINPLELLDPSNFQYAQSICVEECPTKAVQCTPEVFPCTSSSQFQCPYYGYSQFNKGNADGLGILGSEGFASTSWWGSLPQFTGTSCVDAELIGNIPANVSQAMDATQGCGQYYQMTSMYPGQGPCYAILFETAEFMHRCYPVIPKEVTSEVAKVGAGGLAAGISAVPADQLTSV